MAVALEQRELSPALAPPLKWAGGKRWLVPSIMKYWSGHDGRRLVEPFAGGLAITLALQPRRALLNDANPHLINFYKWLKKGLDPSSAGVAFTNARSVYDRNRKEFNDLIMAQAAASDKAAALFYYLNRTGYNGLCRFNSKGLFNVPFGRHTFKVYRSDFSAFKDAFADYSFTSGDFAAMKIEASDFVYADPPYDAHPPYSNSFTSYSAGGFDWDDQLRLAEWLATLCGPVIASNHATARIVRLYKKLGFTVELLRAPRRISCDGNRDEVREMLAMRNL